MHVDMCGEDCKQYPHFSFIFLKGYIIANACLLDHYYCRSPLHYTREPQLESIPTDPHALGEDYEWRPLHS